MELHRFANDRGDTRISADRLDDNFARLKPLPQDGAGRQYSITETPNGWLLRLFPEANNDALSILSSPPSNGTYVLGSVDGVIRWLTTESCE